jgi:hypothetical protein
MIHYTNIGWRIIFSDYQIKNPVRFGTGFLVGAPGMGDNYRVQVPNVP